MFKQKNTHIIELDGLLYGLSGNRLARITDLRDLPGDRFFISDLQEGVSRVITVEAPARYAEVMVRKYLQEAGEFDGPVTVVTHWKKAKKRNTTEIFFTAIPTRLFQTAYVDQLKEHENTILLFPLFQVLFKAINNIAPRKPVALIFQHNRFADLIVGTPKKVYHVNRCIVFDSSAEQIVSLWEAVLHDLRSAEKEQRITVSKIYTVNWIDSSPPPELKEEEGKRFYPLGEKEVLFSEEKKECSFVKIIETLKGIQSPSAPTDKIFYYTEKWAQACNLLLLLATVLLVAGICRNNLQADRLDAKALKLRHEMEGVRLQPPAAISEKSLKETLTLAKQLESYKKTPSFKGVINDLAACFSPAMGLEVLKIDYKKGAVNLEIFGKIASPFETAHKEYRLFLSGLGDRGYTVVENRFGTQIRSSEFLLKLNKEIK